MRTFKVMAQGKVMARVTDYEQGFIDFVRANADADIVEEPLWTLCRCGPDTTVNIISGRCTECGLPYE